MALLVALLLDVDLHSAALSPSLSQIEVAAAFAFHALSLIFPKSPAKRLVVRLFALLDATFEMGLGQLQRANAGDLGFRQRLTKRLVAPSDLLLCHPAQKWLGRQTQNQDPGRNSTSEKQVL
jgi:hypothetical protein